MKVESSTKERKFPLLWYGDGGVALISEMLPSKNVRMEEIWKLKIIPTKELVRAFQIPLEVMNPNREIETEYPFESISMLSHDPSNTVYFCFLDYEGKETPATKYWKGKIEEDKIKTLKDEIERMKARLAAMTEKYMKATTSINKYVREEIMGIANEMSINIVGQQQMGIAKE
jgi:hypothetical protein